MEQQQCPICMLYLLPGMNLQDHLDTHPKDMIIKALLSAKTPALELLRASPAPANHHQATNEMATVFLTTTPFNPSQGHIYHQPQQQTQALLSKRSNSSSQNNSAMLFGNSRPYRWAAIEAQQQQQQQQPTTTFLNATSAAPSSSGNYVNGNARRSTSANDNETAFRCIQQNTEQKNIMIVNTSSTQLSIQQTVPVKKQPTSFELHPVIIDGGGSTQSAISIIPRYTSEKYSGPPPSYESSVTNTINDKQQPRVIDLTQTPTASTSSSSSSTCTNALMKLQNNGNSNKSLSTLAGGSSSNNNNNQAPQKILEYTQNENGDFMITEKVIETHRHGDDANEISIEEISATDDNGYNVKYVEIDEPMEFNMSVNQNEDESMEERQFQPVEDHANYSTPARKLSTGVKVISNVKLTSAEMFSPTIKNIIQQYENSKQNGAEEMQNEQEKSNSMLINVPELSDSEMEEEEEEEIEKEAKVETAELIQCTETLNLSKDKEDSSTAVAGTSVIRKAISNDALIDDKADSPQPSTSSACNNHSNKSQNLVFNSNLSNNRLKPKEIYKQPRKLIVKLKKPLMVVESAEPICLAKNEKEEKMPIKQEIIEEEEISEDEDIKPPKVETPEQFTVTFLDQHDYEPISKITITPEILHDSETNQSIMSMDLEPETSGEIIKREQVEGEPAIIVKTEMNSCSELSMPSHSQNSSCSRSASPGPSTSSRINVESASSPSINESSPINFLYQNDRVRFSPPLSPYVYMKTFSSDDQPKQENDASWNNNSNSLVTQNSDQNSSCSRYTPSFDDNRSNYTDLDINIKTSRSEVHIRAPSTDSLNIRTDEKMPARGEISEQESNGEIEQPWHHPYFQLQAFPSSYDTAQECWNLSKADSQNACDTNNIQNVIINFSPLNGQEDIKAPDLLKTIMQTVTKQEPSGISINDEASGSNSNLIAKKIRTFRCPECSKVFSKLKARNRHTDQEHPHLRRLKKNKVAPTATQTSKSESSIFAPVAGSSSSSALVNWTATSTSQQQEEVKVLSIIKNEPSTSAAVLVKNEMNRMLISTTGSIKMEMDRLLLEPSTSSTSQQQISTLGLKIKRTYMCAKCNEQFRTLKLLDKHFQIHPAECTLCQKTFNSWNTFSLHLKNHLNIRVHACRFCPKRFVQRQRLVEHERIHTGHMPIKCPDCDERFRRYSNMLHHRARVHLNKKAKQEDYVCDCGEIFQTKAKLEWHQETHENKPKPCPYCRERFTHRNSLTRHIRLSHTEKYVFVKSKAVNCPICNCTYLPSSIKAHMATHQISNKEYSCTICSKQFSTKWNLKQHHWTHANRSSKPFQCNVCPSAFVRETDYTTHMNAHRSIKPFTCNTCGKRFVRKYNWLRHSREHEREKKFNCEICQKRFHRAYYLTEHKRVHTGERPFSCTICGKTSATKTNHNKHIKIHHARDPLTAEG